MINKKKQSIFVVSILIIMALTLYLGVRAIKHEALNLQNRQLQQAEQQVKQIDHIINNILTQKATYFEVIGYFLELNNQSIDHLLENELDIKNIFVIQNDNLIYPAMNNPTIDDKTQQWQQLVKFIYNDQSVLLNHYLTSELANPQSGWYMTYDNNGQVLIYWKKQNDVLIGYQVSYVKLLLDIINQFDELGLTDHFLIQDGNQVIYDNRYVVTDNQEDAAVFYYLLKYPLTTWQIEYQYSLSSNLILYWFGAISIMVFIGFIAWIAIFSYREYYRAMILARQQVSFVGQVSHELKTPLTNISLYSEMLKERLVDEPGPTSEYLDVIAQESYRLTRLIQNVLNFTKSAKLVINPIDINVLVAQVCAIFTPVFAQKSMVLTFHPCDDNPIIESDRDSISQIINNLLNNAEKYAQNGHNVDVSVTQSSKHLFIAVRDYGGGIPKNEISMVFKPFYRLNSSLTQEASGTGIGLTIAKQLAQHLQGDLWVKNSYPGATFTLVLPITLSHKE